MGGIRSRLKGLDQRLAQVKKELGKLIRQLSPECQPDNLEPSLGRIELFISQIHEEIMAAAKIQEDEKKLFKLTLNQKLIQECYSRRAVILLERIPTYEDPPPDYFEDLSPTISPNSVDLDLNNVDIKEEIPCSSWNLEIPKKDTNNLKLKKMTLKPIKKAKRKKQRPLKPGEYMYCPLKGCSAKFGPTRIISFEFHKLIHREPFLSAYASGQSSQSQCPLCPQTYSFTTKNSFLLFHIMRVHYNIKISQFTCSFPECGLDFMTKAMKIKHEETHPPGWKDQLALETSNDSYIEEIPAPGSPEVVQNKIKRIARRIKTKWRTPPPEKYLYCPHEDCSERFGPTRIVPFEFHKLTHREPFLSAYASGHSQCPLCPQSYSFTTKNSYLLFHIMRAHYNIKISQFTCSFPECGLDFITKAMKIKHEESHPSGWKNQLALETSNEAIPVPDPPKASESPMKDQTGIKPKKKALKPITKKAKRKKQRPLKPGDYMYCPIEGCSAKFGPTRKIFFEFHKFTHREPSLSTFNPADRQCPLCPQTYSGIRTSYLLFHIMSKHFQVKILPFSCSFPGCSKSFRNNALKLTHEETHQNEKTNPKSKSHPCPQCNHVLSTKVGLIKHKNRAHAPLKCPKCPRTFSKKGARDDHVRKHEILVVCETCGKTMDKYEYYFHAYTHKGDYFKCGIEGCKLGFGSTLERRGHHEEAHTRSFICDRCSNDFFTMTELKQHQKVHEFPFVCDFEGCGKRFNPQKKSIFERHVQSHKNDLEEQNRLKNSSKPTFTCEDCGRIYTKLQSLNYHKESVHSSAKWICEHEGCGKVFKHAERLRQHKLYHSKEKSKCKFCPKSFVSPILLKTHYAKNHRKLINLGLKCGICGDSYARKRFLDIHMEKAHGSG